jgi:hypothetical protein
LLIWEDNRDSTLQVVDQHQLFELKQAKKEKDREIHRLIRKNMAQAEWSWFTTRKNLQKKKRKEGKRLNPREKCQLGLLDGWFRDPNIRKSRAAARRGINQADTSNFYDYAGLLRLKCGPEI